MMAVGITCYRAASRERTMNIRAVILWASTKKSRWCEAAEVVGISDRQIRRWEWTTSPQQAVRCGPNPVKVGFVPESAHGSIGRRLLPDKSFWRIRPRAQCSHFDWSKKRGSGQSA